jgi:hypothetical protein
MLYAFWLSIVNIKSTFSYFMYIARFARLKKTCKVISRRHLLFLTFMIKNRKCRYTMTLSVFQTINFNRKTFVI